VASNDWKMMKVPPEFKEWIKKRRDNMKKANLIPAKISMMEAMRYIAKTEGISLDELRRKMRK